MRRILLGCSAIAGASLLGVVPALAQEAPTIRIGGFFRAYYGHTQQSGRNSTVSTTLPNNVASASGNLPANGSGIARLSKNDFSTDAEVRVLVNGKAANGLSYGAVVEIAFNQQEGRNIVQQRASSGKTTASIDEAYAFVSSATFGQLRFGDEDGPVGGLMNSGVITNFGSGGIYGDRESFVVRQAGARTMTSPGSIGDSTKIIYLSPQYFGFDFGASFAFNFNEGEDSGCPSNAASGWCDSAYAFTGASAIGVPASGGGFAVRRNEHQAALRWRGALAGVGLAFTGGYVGATAARELTTTGTQARVFNNLNVAQFGAQATLRGVTVGVQYEHGDANYFWGNTLRGDRPMDQFFAGASYTNGPFTIGGNYVIGTFEGTSRGNFSAAAANASGGQSSFVANPGGAAMMRRLGYGIGGNYRIAPGLDLLAEYSSYTVAERGRDLDPQNDGVQDKSTTQVFILGTRLAF